MTEEQRETYRLMQDARILSNTEGTDREFLIKEIEELRKTLGGMQYAPTPQEPPHKSDLQHNPREMDKFPRCPKCKRMLHYSVISNVCYSCARE